CAWCCRSSRRPSTAGSVPIIGTALYYRVPFGTVPGLTDPTCRTAARKEPDGGSDHEYLSGGESGFLLGETSLDHLGGVGLGGLTQRFVQVGVALDELRYPRDHAGHVLPDQHLGVGTRTGADTHGRNGKLLGDLGAKIARHHFQDDRERARPLHFLGVLEELFGRSSPSLDTKTPDRVDRLGGQPDVGH